MRERLCDLELPVLFIRGEHSTLVSRTGVAKLAAACRRGRAIEIPGAFHHLTIDRPHLHGAMFRAFLEEATGEPRER